MPPRTEAAGRLGWAGRADPLLGLPLFFAIAAGAGVLAVESGGGPWAALPALALSALAAVWLASRDRPAQTGTRRDQLVALGVAALGLAWAALLFGAGDVLPPGDGIAVPQLAKSLAAGIPLAEAYPAGSSGHAYPPGYPALFAPAMAGLEPAPALVLFKLVTVAIAGLIPAAWGWMHRQLFEPEAPLWRGLAVSYVAFIVLERHLGFITPFAGKNAVQLALLLFPAVAVAVVRLSAAPRAWPLAALPLFGLFLIHYSMVHLAAAFLGALFAARRPWDRAGAARAAAAGALALAALLLTAGEALHDPRAATGPWALGPGLSELGRNLLSASPPIVIFHDPAFGLVPAPFRGVVLIAAGLLAVLVGRRLGRTGLSQAAAAYGLALLVSLLFGTGLIPAGVSLDFVRHFAWPLQAGLFATALLSLLALRPRLAGRRGRLFAAGAVAIGLALAAISARDAYVERRFFASRTLTGAELREVAEALPQRGPCGLIAPGQSLAEGLVTVQDAAAWNYAETVSPCSFLTGSWVRPPAPGGRDLDGLPSAAALNAAPRRAPVFFVGSSERLGRYAGALEVQGVDLAWTPVGADVGGAALWRAVARRAATSAPGWPSSARSPGAESGRSAGREP